MTDPGIEVGLDEAGEPIVLTNDEFTRLSIVAAGDDPGAVFAAVLDGQLRQSAVSIDDLIAAAEGRSGASNDAPDDGAT